MVIQEQIVPEDIHHSLRSLLCRMKQDRLIMGVKKMADDQKVRDYDLIPWCIKPFLFMLISLQPSCDLG